MIFVISLLKLLYNDPRPYMVNSEISAKAENLGGGHPSGHAFIAFLLFSWICEEFFLENRKFYKNMMILEKQNLEEKSMENVGNL